MKQLSAILVDDEQEGIDTLSWMLREYCPEVKIIGTFQSSVTALKEIKKLQADILFLDIQMPHINGLELLELLGSDSYNVIYTTAYDAYVLQALRLSAIDYLKKPIDEKELIQAVQRVKPSGNIAKEQIQNTLNQFKTNQRIDMQSPFGIKVGNAIKFVKLIDICYCKSDGNFTEIYLVDGSKIYSSNALKVLQKRLPKAYFFRTHREYIINLHQVTEYNKSEGGYVKMNRMEGLIPVSRGRSLEFGEVLVGVL